MQKSQPKCNGTKASDDAATVLQWYKLSKFIGSKHSQSPRPQFRLSPV